MTHSATISINAVNHARWDENTTPPHTHYCFANVPGTVYNILTKAPSPLPTLPNSVFGAMNHHYDAVVLCFIDAFGWRFFESFSDSVLIKRLEKYGAVSKITSMFPSTTSAHVTTMNTGLHVAETGIYEWFYYEPIADAVIAPLLYSFAGDKHRETLHNAPINSADIFPFTSLYETLGQRGITSSALLPTAITHTTYSSALFRGATIYGYKTLPEALINLSDRVLNTPKPHYFYFYYPEIDTIAHDYGASSQQVQAQIHAFLTLFESLFLNRLAGKAKNTLLVLIADHGHVDTPPEKTIYLNLAIPRIANYFMTTSQGAPIVPAGSPRDMFLYVKPDYLDELYAMLNHKLGHMARVYRTHDLINKGVFGAQQHVSQRFLQRVGNIVILPHEGESVWWYEKNRFDNSIRGHHGGLSKLEMETPFIMYDLG